MGTVVSEVLAWKGQIRLDRCLVQFGFQNSVSFLLLLGCL